MSDEEMFDRLESSLSEDLVFLRPDFTIGLLCSHVGASEKDIDKYLSDNFGITLREMVRIYAETHFDGILFP